MTLPSLFISHGTPMLALAETSGPDADPFAEALHRFAKTLPRPDAIIVVSAHGTSPAEGAAAQSPLVEISIGHRNSVEYDFGGFPGELYQLTYPAPGAPELSARIASLLADAGFQTSLNSNWRLDHGVWVPLRIAFPSADIPVIQVSLPYPGDPRLTLKLGRALAPLRLENCLLIGSGGGVHNLGELNWAAKSSTRAEPWAVEFEDWVIENLQRKDVETLLHFENEAPSAARAHPTPEHFFPIFFPIGATLPKDEAVVIHRGIEYGTLSMLTVALSPADVR